VPLGPTRRFWLGAGQRHRARKILEGTAMDLDALILDVDGTLADTEEAHRVAFNLAFGRRRLDWSWSRAQYRDLLEVSGGRERLMAYIASLSLPHDEIRRLQALVPAIHAEKTKFYTSMLRDGAIGLRTGVARLIDEALVAGVRLGLSSSSSPASVDALLSSAFGSRRGAAFGAVVCGGDPYAKKPAPAGYRAVLQRLGTAAGRTLAFEDSNHGLRAALGAGLRTVITPTYWTEHEDFTGAWLVLPHLGEPDHPLPGEPGNRLQVAPWLTWQELDTTVALMNAER
jgi:beta-phosphoglucomutase-like phosphatase (HAD superfamily)